MSYIMLNHVYNVGNWHDCKERFHCIFSYQEGTKIIHHSEFGASSLNLCKFLICIYMFDLVTHNLIILIDDGSQ